jgi:transcription elongation GreA/GreB family factor
MKSALIAAWRETLQTRLDTLTRTANEARSATRVDGTHRPANRGERAAVTSAGYLAQGLGQRASELAEALRLLDEMGDEPRDRVVVGALVELEDQWLAVFPGGDATRLTVDGTEVLVLSARAPMAQVLLGLEEGDEARLALPGGQRQLVICSVG